jgi:hypothetical protein
MHVKHLFECISIPSLEEGEPIIAFFFFHTVKDLRYIKIHFCYDLA